MVSFNIVTQSAFDAMTNKDNDALYFTSDTHRIYKGANLYTGGVVSVVSTVPTASNAQIGVIYVVSGSNTSNAYAMYYYDGTEVKQIGLGVVKTVSNSDTVIPTSKAVKTYVDNAISDAVGSSGVVSGVSYNVTDTTTGGQDQRSLTVTKGDGTTQTVQLSDILTRVAYDSENLTLTFYGSYENPVVVNLPEDNFIASGSYDEANNDIVIVLRDGSTIRIPADELVDIYTGTSTTSVTVSVSSGNVISAAIRPSTTAGNILQVDTNGVFVPDTSTGKMDKLTAPSSNMEGNVVTYAGNGQGTVSSYLMGGANFQAAPSAYRLATESGVANELSPINTAIGTINTTLGTKVNTSDVITEIDASRNSATKVTSERAVVSALSWNVIS